METPAIHSVDQPVGLPAELPAQQPAGLAELAVEVARVLSGVDPRWLGDDELLLSMGAVEQLGRLVDAARITHAAEVAERSRIEHGGDRLSARKGCRSANELIQRVTGVSGFTAERRMRLGVQTRSQLSLAGVEFPARFPQVAAALLSGELGVDAGWAIISALVPTLPRVGIDALVAAETELVAAATDGVRFTADEIRLQARVWQACIDPDGVEPAEERAMSKRGLRLGAEQHGLVSIQGRLVAEVAAKLARALDAHLSPRSGVTFLPDDGRPADDRVDDARSDEDRSDDVIVRDERSSDQQRHDVFAALIDAAARSAEMPTIGGAAPTVLVSVRAADLASGTGAGGIDGSTAPLSMRAVTQFACAGGIQKILLGDSGRVLRLWSPERCFTPQQRRAISLRDGGCVIPGCSVPAGWCEIHHVTPAATGGPTDPDNGVLVCWFHHRTIDTVGWEITMSGGAPRVKAPPWLDPGGRWHPVTTSPTRIADRITDRIAGRVSRESSRIRARR